MSRDNQFNFTHSRQLPGVTVLDAVMSDFSYEKHAHEEIAVGVTLEGRQDFSCGGVGYRSMPGNVILFNPGDVHDGHPGDGSTLRYTMLYIRPERIVELARDAERHGDASLRVPVTVCRDRALGSHVLALSRLMTSQCGSVLEQEMRLYEIARILFRKSGAPGPADWPHKKEARMVQARDYIHANLERDISIEELSAVANLSKYHFIRMFHGHFGSTPHQYVLNCRINRAKAVLSEGTSPTQTAQLLGFSDVSHLNRRFKRAYGVTPKQYQVQLLR